MTQNLDDADKQPLELGLAPWMNNTRSNKCSVCLPRIRIEYARKSFYYMGAKTFNELPLTARMSENAFALREIMNNVYV